MAITTAQLRRDLAGARGDLGAMLEDNSARAALGKPPAHLLARLESKGRQIRDLEKQLRNRGEL